jgi:hypothetical protein
MSSFGAAARFPALGTTAAIVTLDAAALDHDDAHDAGGGTDPDVVAAGRHLGRLVMPTQ